MQNENFKKKYTLEEIKKIAPGYNGKPENFNPTKANKGRANKKPKSTRPMSPTQLQTTLKPTLQKNSSLLESQNTYTLKLEYCYFGIDVQVLEITGREVHMPTFARLPEIVEEIVTVLNLYEPALNKKLVKEMCMYYATAHLWARILNVKEKNATQALTDQEQLFLKFVGEMECNMPEPLYLYLRSIGNIKDKTGKTLFLEDLALPTAVAQNFGGYVANTISNDNHNLFEEIPCLGVIGDTLMPIAGANVQPVAPNFRVVPQGRTASTSLCGYYGVSGLRKEDIAITLFSMGITSTSFSETVPGTRLNIKLVQYVNDFFAKTITFKIEKVTHKSLCADGDAVLLIRSKPVFSENMNPNVKWTQLYVMPYLVNKESSGTIGASYFTGFQLYKEAIPDGEAQSNANWYCLVPTAMHPIPQAVIDNRNARRVLPPGFDVDRFIGISDSQKNRTNAIMRRLIKT